MTEGPQDRRAERASGDRPPFPAESPAPPDAVVAGTTWEPVAPRQPTASVTPRPPRTAMGPLAPVAGALMGLLVGLLVTFLGLAPGAQAYAERLASVFVCLGLALLGAGGVLFADEVRVRRRVVTTQSAEVVAGLLNGLTPARFLVGAAGFVLLLAAYVTPG